MSFSETIFLFLLALIIFGPKKLPEIARMVGKTLNEFRRASNEFKMQIEHEIAHLEVEKKQTILPPGTPPDNTASRSMTQATSGESTARPSSESSFSTSPETNNAADEPLFATEAVAGATSETHTPPVATEALPASEAAPSPTSQESHA